MSSRAVLVALLVVLCVLTVAESVSYPRFEEQLHSNSSTPAPHQHIIKSRSDDRRYKRIQLDNGLDVLLVYSPTSTKSAAAMNIRVGYWNDPPELPGLAHFLEHMLFLGTTEFPEEGGFRSYLYSHGGSSNAYTSKDRTNFFFDIQSNALYGTLRRFSQFFISPLLSESATEREVKAVENEHIKNLERDSRRKYRLIQSLVRPDHPFHKFGTGSAESLGAVEKHRLQTYLRNFWQTYYVTSNMQLTVQGRKSFKVLERWVRKLFANVPVAKGPIPSPLPANSTYDTIFPTGFLPAFVNAETVRNTRAITVSWTLPPQSRNYAMKSSRYISAILGGEEPGSLLSVLKKKGWAVALSAGTEISTSSFDMFQVYVRLTRRGFHRKRIKKIIGMIYRHIRFIELQGIEEWRWKELGTISAINFRLKSKESSRGYVSHLASVLHKYEPQDILVANYLFRTFNPDHIRSLLKLLHPNRMLVLVMSKRKHFGELDKSEKWYGVRYGVQRFSNDELGFYHSARTDDSPASQDDIALPPPNKFIPSSLLIKPKRGLKKLIEYPSIIKDVVSRKRGTTRVWFKQDHIFRRPKANIRCKFWSGISYATPRDSVIATVYSKLVRDVLRQENYPAAVAGMVFKFWSDVDSLSFRASGYDASIKSFVDHSTKFVMLKSPNAPKDSAGFVPNARRFRILKNSLRHKFKNFKFAQPYVHGSHGLSLLLQDPHWSTVELQQAIEDIEYDQLIEWSRRFWQDAALECLIHGNLYRTEALAIADSITTNIPFKSNHQLFRTMNMQTQRIVELDGAYTFWKFAPNRHDRNSAIYQYYQAKSKNFIDDVSTQLLAMMMKKPAFHQLRTREQLGYLVWSGADSREGVNGIRIIVQSPTYPANHLHKRVRHFVKKLRKHIRTMKRRKLFTYITTLARFKMQLPPSLAVETAKYWREIATQQYQFDRRFRELIALKSLTRRGFRDFVDRLIGWHSVPSMISVQVQSQRTLEEAAEEGESNPRLPQTGLAPAKRASKIRRTLSPERSLKVRRAFAAMERKHDLMKEEKETDRESLLDRSPLPMEPELALTSAKHRHWRQFASFLEVSARAESSDDKSKEPSKAKPTHKQISRRKAKANRFADWVSEIPCSKSGPRRWHMPVELTIESTNTFRSGMCLHPKRSVGPVVLPSYAIVRGYPKRSVFRLHAANSTQF